jgi:hypothetical protein
MNLLETQRSMAAALMVPLERNGRVARKTADGNSMAAEAARIIKPNDRLSSLERLEIYSRSYWFRLLDSFTDDFPGLRAIVGEKAFERLACAYLRERPSRSFTLRDLGSQLIEWLDENPAFVRSHRALALDMARLEWAHIVAFDGPQDPVLDPEHLLEPGPGLRVGVQPYITLLELQYPVDELRVAIRSNEEGSATASNTFNNGATHRKRRAIQKVGQARKEQLFVAVHRVDSSVYYRRLEPEEFRLLEALRDGRPVVRAIQEAFCESTRTAEEIPGLLESWFGAWAQFGWLTVFQKKRKGSGFK